MDLESLGFVPSQDKSKASPEDLGFVQHESPTQESLMKRYGRMALKALPAAGAIGGEVVGALSMPVTGPAGPLAGPVVGAGVGKALQDAGESLMGESDKTASERIAGPIKEAGEMAALEMLPVAKAGELVAKGINKTADYFKGTAEKVAENATGATAKEVIDKFKPGTGRELLDTGVVKAGDTQFDIAEKAGKAVEAANAKIDTSLKALDDKGVTVSLNDIYKQGRDRITALRKTSATHDVADHLETELDNLVKTAEARGWQTDIPISEAEQEKREFNRKAKNWANPRVGVAGKEMYQIWRKAVEDEAEKHAPEIAEQFTEAKKAYGTMAPIEEAAFRRAQVQKQHQAAGLYDVLTAGEGAAGGYAVAGVPGAIAGGVGLPIARRVVAPRMSSTTAAAFDSAGNILKTLPKYAEMATKDQAGFRSAVMTYMDHNQEERAAKGRAKWAMDGYDNLLEHGADLDLLGRAKEDPKMRSLLIDASDAKPGSKAMDKILERLKAQGEKK